MKHHNLLAILVIFLLAQIPGCHYYIDATPHITLSSEPLNVTVTRENHVTPIQLVPLLPPPAPVIQETRP